MEPYGWSGARTGGGVDWSWQYYRGQRPTYTLFTQHKNNRSVPKISEPYRARNRAGMRLHCIKNNRAESFIEGVIEHVRISISALQLARAIALWLPRVCGKFLDLLLRCMRSFTEHRQSE